MTTAGMLTQYSLPSGGSPRGITYDTAGRLWVADNSSDGVWMLTPAAHSATPVLAKRSAHLGCGRPRRRNLVHRRREYRTVQSRATPVSPKQLSPVPVPRRISQPVPTTRLVHRECFGQRFRCATSRSTAATDRSRQTPFPTGTNPLGIAAGADNAMWFVDKTANTRRRDFTDVARDYDFPIPTSNAQPLEIVRGPDGSLWFTENNAGQIGHVVP